MINVKQTTRVRKMLFSLSLLAMFALQACSDDAGQHAAPPLVSAQAESMVVNATDVATHYVTSGSVSSDHRVLITSRISGYIRKLSVREGDRVKKGQVLVRIDPVNARQSLLQAEADLADARTDKQRYEALFRDHAASRQQLDRVRLRYKVAKSQAVQARNHLGYAEVRSPVDGVVVEKRMSKGDLASPGAAILMIEDPASLLVNTYVSEQFVSMIHAGDTVDVEIPSIKRHISGMVRQVVEAADAISHQFLIKITLQDSALHPGMYAQVGFSTGSRKALMVPVAAIVERAGLHGVYVVGGHGIVHYRQIRVGSRHDDKVEVLAGLRIGDVIAWAGRPELKTGMQVSGLEVGSIEAKTAPVKSTRAKSAQAKSTQKVATHD